MAKGPQVGQQAPDFELEGTAGTFKLSDHHGEKVVLLFYPADNTPGCTKQFCSYRDRSADFSGLEATVVGISSQSLDSHRAFTDKHGLTVPLLADIKGKVAKSYGVHAPVVGTRRAVLIVDEQGIVRYRHVYAIGIGYPGTDELREALEQIATPV